MWSSILSSRVQLLDSWSRWRWWKTWSCSRKPSARWPKTLDQVLSVSIEAGQTSPVATLCPGKDGRVSRLGSFLPLSWASPDARKLLLQSCLDSAWELSGAILSRRTLFLVKSALYSLRLLSTPGLRLLSTRKQDLPTITFRIPHSVTRTNPFLDPDKEINRKMLCWSGWFYPEDDSWCRSHTSSSTKQEGMTCTYHVGTNGLVRNSSTL